MYVSTFLTHPVVDEEDLKVIKKLMLPAINNMGVSTEILNFPVVLTEDSYFRKNSDACYTKKEIMIKRGIRGVKLLGDLSHEYGHEGTLFGDFGTKSNIINETAAFYFEKKFINSFNQIYSQQVIFNNGSFIAWLKKSYIHAISFYLSSLLPIGKMLKAKYRV